MRLSLTTGALTTNGIVRTGHGVLTYAEAGGGAVALYDGLSTTANLISRIAANTNINFNAPVQFNAGLYITVASSDAVVHTA